MLPKKSINLIYREMAEDLWKKTRIMVPENVIQKILEQKKLPHLRFSIKEKTEAFTKKLFYTLFDNDTPVDKNLNELEKEFEELAGLVSWEQNHTYLQVWDTFIAKLPEIIYNLSLDAKAITEHDPAANSLEEVYLAYPGFFAIAIYRLSHELNKSGLPLVPRLMSECAHKLTGTDINPGAVIGVPFFIDHATGVVIGETCIIKNNVKIYQGVTLGALSVDKSLRNKKRHPTIEENVTIYANATILGGNTVIGANSVIGGNVWLTSSVPENSMVSHTPHIKIQNSAQK